MYLVLRSPQGAPSGEGSRAQSPHYAVTVTVGKLAVFIPSRKMYTAERVNHRNSDFTTMPNFTGLEGTAFNINQQIELLFESEDLQTWINQTNEDLRYLYYEFLAKLKVIPFDMKLVDGKLYCENYRKFFLDTVSEQERNGATQFTVWQIHNFLMEAETGSMAAFVSPSGWAPPYGKYPDTQIYLYKKTSENAVEAVTLVNKMNIDECEDYLGFFDRGGQEVSLDPHLRIEDVVLTPIFWNTDKHIDFEDFIHAIKVVSDHDITILINQLQNREQLKQIKHTQIADILDNFAEAAKENVNNISDPEQIVWLKQFLRQTILEMSAVSRGVGSEVPRTEAFYQEEQQHLLKASEEGPCPSLSVVQSPGGPRLVVNGREVLKCVKCPFCGKTVDAQIYDRKIWCEDPPKGCGRWAPYSKAA